MLHLFELCQNVGLVLYDFNRCKIALHRGSTHFTQALKYIILIKNLKRYLDYMLAVKIFVLLLCAFTKCQCIVVVALFVVYL